MNTSTPAPEGHTRQKILDLLLDHGTLSASQIAHTLGLSAAGVRRHLDNLLAEDVVEEAPATGGSTRGRGRPARVFRLTDKGRGTFGYDYDRVAVLALQALRQAGGESAVIEFASERMREIVSEAAIVDGDPAEVAAKKLAKAFARHGYAATVDQAGGGVQICRHHCPIQGVAEHFPEMCAAEHAAVREALGQHIQPLATIVDGNGVCTTHIPLRSVTRERE